MPAIIGTRVATAALDIRTTSGADSKTVAEVKKGTVLSVTGATQNGRAQIIYKKKIRWVTAKYLANPQTNLPAPPGLPKITGRRYATTELNIRSTYKDKYTLIAEVPTGTRLSITGVIKKKRMQIVYNNAARWVTAKYLSKTKPKASPGGKYKVEKGLKPNAIKVHRAILKEFPEIVTFYGVRADAIPDHPTGRALDCMIPNYKSAHGKALGFRHVPLGPAQRRPTRHQLRDLGPAHLEQAPRQPGLALHGRPRERLGQPQEPRTHHRVCGWVRTGLGGRDRCEPRPGPRTTGRGRQIRAIVLARLVPIV